MELVIKLLEDSYKATCNGSMLPSDVGNVVNAIRNGISLPKGHGRLIDESKITVCEWVDDFKYDYPKASTDAPTIIEADGGAE